MKPTIKSAQSVSAPNFVRAQLPTYIKKWRDKYSEEFDADNIDHINRFIETMEKNVTLSLRQEIEDQVNITEGNPIKLTVTKSNLGKGYLFWFLCNLCGNRVKSIYAPRFSETWACRKCHKLTYLSQRNNDSKYFKKFFGGRI